ALIESIEGKIVRRKSDRTLPVILRARERVVCLELQIIRQTTIRLKHERMVFRKNVATNFSDLREVRVRSRSRERVCLCASHEDRCQISAATERSPEYRNVNEPCRRRQVRIDEVWQ